MKRFYNIMILLLMALTAAAAAQGVPLSPAGGVLDLRQWNPAHQPSLSLRGDWEFYWSQFYTPYDFNAGRSGPGNLIEVPSSWQLKGYPLHGFATYRLKVVLDHPRELAIRFPWIQASARIFIDDVLLTEIGKVGSSENPLSYQPSVREDYWVFTPRHAAFDIIVQAANHDYLMSGMVGTPIMGTASFIKAGYIKDIALILFCSGSIFIMGIYHFCLFALRTKAPSTLYFGVACVLVSLYVSASHLPTVSTFLPDISHNNALRLYFIWALTIGFFAYFFHELYPALFPRRLAPVATLSSTGVYLYLLVYDFRSITVPLILLQVLIGTFSLYVYYALVKAIRNREDGAVLVFSGVIVLGITVIHDIFKYLYDSPNLAGFGVLTFIICQSFLLARRFSNAFNRVETSEQEIRKLSDNLRIQHEKVVALNENLEHLVDEKTRDIRSIMSHIQLGIFAITREGFRIHKDYSLHLTSIFEKDDLCGVNACELLFENSSLNADEISQATAAIDTSLGGDVLGFQINRHCLPAEFKYRRPHGRERILELSWNAISNDDIVEKILVTVRDVTDLRILQEEACDRKEELEFISELVNISAEAFNRFIASCQDLLAENRRLLHSRSVQLQSMEILKVLFINVHTLKGAARSLYLKKIAKILHEVEQYYALLQTNAQAEWDIAKMRKDLDEVDGIIALYESINREKLGRKTHGDEIIELHESEILSLYSKTLSLSEHVNDASHPTSILARNMQQTLAAHIFTPVRQVMDQICESVITLAKDLKKAKPRITIITSVEGDLMLNRQGENLLRKIFIHILRNSMDHGIEQADERRSKGKAEQGHLDISFKEERGAILLRYRDDGRGLDINKIRETAGAQGFTSEHHSLSPEKIAELIFEPGFSTTTDINDISGRGVGMEAVKNFLKAAGGDIKIHLMEESPPRSGCYPFYFDIRLPHTLFCHSEKPWTGQAA
jgi:HPt (histidine-containing phosphotransfer) domain-containing protein